MRSWLSVLKIDLLRRWDLKGPLENIVASLAYAWRAPVAPYFLPCRSRFISHCERSRSKPTPSPSRSDGGDRDGSNPIPKRKKQRTPNWCPCFLWKVSIFNTKDKRNSKWCIFQPRFVSLMYTFLMLLGGERGIRTLVCESTNWFRVSPVMTTSHSRSEFSPQASYLSIRKNKNRNPL